MSDELLLILMFAAFIVGLGFAYAAIMAHIEYEKKKNGGR